MADDVLQVYGAATRSANAPLEGLAAWRHEPAERARSLRFEVIEGPC